MQHATIIFMCGNRGRVQQCSYTVYQLDIATSPLCKFDFRGYRELGSQFLPLITSAFFGTQHASPLIVELIAWAWWLLKLDLHEVQLLCSGGWAKGYLQLYIYCLVVETLMRSTLERDRGSSI